jgi:starch synthase
MMAWARRIPLYATFQGGDGHPPGLEDALRPRTLRLARGFAVATTAERERLRRVYGVPPERIHPVTNPVDLETWWPEERAAARAALGLPGSARVAVWHGRVDMRRKGLDVLLDAWTRIAAEGGGERRLLLVGSGADDEVLRARLAEPALASVRWIAGYRLDRAEMRRTLSAADVYAMPSRTEGLPVAPLEAMACGLPVAASDIPSLRDILERGLDSGGLTAPVGDAGAFAAALGRFLDDPALALATGRNARATVAARFSVDAVAEQLGAMLRRG